MGALIKAGGHSLGEAKYRRVAGLISLWPEIGTIDWLAAVAMNTASCCDATEVAYLQGIAPLAIADAFRALCAWTTTSATLWAVNLSSVPFKGPQIEHLVTALSESNITHLRLDCPELTPELRAKLEAASWAN
jgi:hypothetical protein